MIGAIAGDIVGSRFEWAYMKSKDFELFPPKKCSFTDDSVMTIAIAAALADWKAGGGELHDHAIGIPHDLYRLRHLAGCRLGIHHLYGCAFQCQ